MPEPPNLEKAELREIWWDQGGTVHDGDSKKTLKVQFNPETLTVTYSNQSAGGDQRGGSAIQFVGRGTTKLSLELWFDVSRPQPDGAAQEKEDVRKLTERVSFFMTPTPASERPRRGQQQKYVPPGVRFIWGTFLFEGIMDSLTEKLEYFSPEGKPLRASVTVGLTSQEIQHKFWDPKSAQAAGAGADSQPPGTRPQQQPRSRDNLPQMAAKNGQRDNWHGIGEQNNVDNPRRLAPERPIDMNPAPRR